MKISLDFHSGQPIYAQIMDQIWQMIVAGMLKPGEQLPPVRQLAAELQVNFNTVARAYRLLDQSGLISTQQGRGTYVWEEPCGASINQLKRQRLESLTRRFLVEAFRLEFSVDEVREIFLHNIQAWQE